MRAARIRNTLERTNFPITTSDPRETASGEIIPGRGGVAWPRGLSGELFSRRRLFYPSFLIAA